MHHAKPTDWRRRPIRKFEKLQPLPRKVFVWIDYAWVRACSLESTLLGPNWIFFEGISECHEVSHGAFEPAAPLPYKWNFHAIVIVVRTTLRDPESLWVQRSDAESSRHFGAALGSLLAVAGGLGQCFPARVGPPVGAGDAECARLHFYEAADSCLYLTLNRFKGVSLIPAILLEKLAIWRPIFFCMVYMSHQPGMSMCIGATTGGS